LEPLGVELEVIVVDDHSTDATIEIVRQDFADPRLRLIQASDLGAAAARNQGLAIARGELIAFLDADDLWHPDKLASQVMQLQAHPEAAMAYSWTHYIDHEGNPLYPGRRWRYEGDVYAALFENNFIESGSNLLIRRSALNHVGGFDPSFTCVHDWELWLRLAEHYPVALVRQVHVQYRQHPGTISSNLKGQEQFSRRVIDEAFRRTPDRLQGHRCSSLSNLYQYLTFKSLQQNKTRRQTLTSLRYLTQSLVYDPSVIGRRSILLTRTFGKIGLRLLGVTSSTSSLGERPKVAGVPH
jgi:glycosyltransferase involved in cell wall biosynthesis